MIDLVLSTSNEGKIREIREILGGLPIRMLTKDDFESWPEIVEDGQTYLDNALIKAGALMEVTGLAALGEDSGLEVDFLGGAPGVRSARFSGENASDRSNNELLIASLESVPPEKRTARYRCVAVVVFPDRDPIGSVGTCEGRIGLEARGSFGFGYDPWFIPEGEDRTMAQLSPPEKNAISHRGRALRGLAEYLRKAL